ncbi:MAG: heme ABC exporter ATP-binding protein CcmA [Pseudomonadales bacterium]
MPAEAGRRTLLALGDLGCARDGRWLFRDLTLELAAGAGLELVGPNGSGKSTLLRTLAGLDEPQAGTVSAAPHVYLGHRPGLSGLLSVAMNLRWYAELQGVAADLDRVLGRVGLTGYDDVPCRALSAGQQRRVALARLCLGGAPLWLLDEPLTALDASGQALVAELIAGHLAAGGAAVWSTHQPLSVAGVRQLTLGAAVEGVL